ncbi:hypothetical protein DFH27DRAFT_20296 [Peziza echinospora]|nr:hypothetical protein DFH27DRAFT_20296 [Peziza echinospora]
MTPEALFRAEIAFGAVTAFLLLCRTYILRHKERRRADWLKDIQFWGACVLCMLTTGTLAWYCWQMIHTYEDMGTLVDQGMAEAAKNSTVDLSKASEQELAVIMQKLKAQRENGIELLTQREMLNSSYRRVMFFCWAGYVTELWLLKGAFLAFYWRLFARTKTRFLYLLLISSIVTFITYVIVITIHFTWTNPASSNWTSSLEDFPKISSMNSLTTLTIGSFLNIGTDLMILLLPLLIIRSYNLKRREKIGLTFTFAVGTFSVAASVVRYVILYQPYKYPPATLSGLRQAYFWSTLEVVTGLFAFSLLSFRPVLMRALKKGKKKVAERHSRLSRSTGHADSSNKECNIMSESKASSAFGGIDLELGGEGKRGKRPAKHPSALLTEDMISLTDTTKSRGGDTTPPLQPQDRYQRPSDPPQMKPSPPPRRDTTGTTNTAAEEDDTVGGMEPLLKKSHPSLKGRSTATASGSGPKRTFDPSRQFRRPEPKNTYPDNAIQVTSTISVTTSTPQTVTPPPPAHIQVQSAYKNTPDGPAFFNHTPPGQYEPSSECTSEGAPVEPENPLEPVQKAYNPAHEGSSHNLMPGSSVGFYVL